MTTKLKLFFKLILTQIVFTLIPIDYTQALDNVSFIVGLSCESEIDIYIAHSPFSIASTDFLVCIAKNKVGAGLFYKKFGMITSINTVNSDVGFAIAYKVIEWRKKRK